MSEEPKHEDRDAQGTAKKDNRRGNFKEFLTHLLKSYLAYLLISAQIAKRSLVGSAHGQLTFKRSHRLA
jgi:hypothetical protein